MARPCHLRPTEDFKFSQGDRACSMLTGAKHHSLNSDYRKNPESKIKPHPTADSGSLVRKESLLQTPRTIAEEQMHHAGGPVVKNLPASTGYTGDAEDAGSIPGLIKNPLEKELATHSCILAWKLPCAEEPGGLHFMGLQRAGHA